MDFIRPGFDEDSTPNPTFELSLPGTSAG
jgi:hypothetical protein